MFNTQLLKVVQSSCRQWLFWFPAYTYKEIVQSEMKICLHTLTLKSVFFSVPVWFLGVQVWIKREAFWIFSLFRIFSIILTSLCFMQFMQWLILSTSKKMKQRWYNRSSPYESFVRGMGQNTINIVFKDVISCSTFSHLNITHQYTCIIPLFFTCEQYLYYKINQWTYLAF